MPPRKLKKDKGKAKDAVEIDEPDYITYNETVHFIIEFLEVAFNTILYIRQVYPAYIFAKMKKYDTPVWKARPPMLATYLADAAKAVGEQLSPGVVQQVCLAIRSVRTNAIVESFNFDFTYLVERSFLLGSEGKNTKIEGSPSRSQLAMLLRGLLLKLNVAESQLNGYPAGETTFDIGIKMQDDIDYDPTMIDRTKKKTPLWMPNQVDEERMVSIPLRTANLGAINMQIFVHENTSKAGPGEEGDDDLEDLFRKLDKGKGRAIQ